MVDVDSIIDPLQSFIPPPVTAVSTDASVETADTKALNPVESDSKVELNQMELHSEDSNQVVLPSEEPTLIVAQFPVQDGVEDTLESVLVAEVEQLTLSSSGDGVGPSTNETIEADSKEIIN